jgi:hypothetical protein
MGNFHFIQGTAIYLLVQQKMGGRWSLARKVYENIVLLRVTTEDSGTIKQNKPENPEQDSRKVWLIYRAIEFLGKN